MAFSLHKKRAPPKINNLIGNPLKPKQIKELGVKQSTI